MTMGMRPMMVIVVVVVVLIGAILSPLLYPTFTMMYYG